MKRWLLAVVGVVAVGLAFLLIRGGSTTPSTPPPVPVAPPPPIDQTNPAVGKDFKAQPTPGSIPGQLADPNTPPDVRAAASVAGWWSALAGKMRYARDPDPAWTAVVDDTERLANKITAFRKDPTTGSWPDLLAEQRALIPRLRAANPDENMTKELDEIEKRLGAQ